MRRMVMVRYGGVPVLRSRASALRLVLSLLASLPIAFLAGCGHGGGGGNHAPVAGTIGAPDPVREGERVTLDGSSFTDPDGDPLTYSWTQTGGPAASLEGATTAVCTFLAPGTGQDAELTFKLIASDGSATTEAVVTAKVTNIADLDFLAVNGEGYLEYRHVQTGIVLVRLPGGRFDMGSPDTEEGRFSAEGPVHEVTLSPFLIAKTEVTQAQWRGILGSAPSGFTGDDSLPVENVSWDDIQEFETRTGLALPSEAQWEYACRAGTTGSYAGTGNLDDMGWYHDDSGGATHAAGGKRANGFGLLDVHGNVAEWCEDVYDAGFYGKPAAAGPDPLSAAGSENRVVRGGSWLDLARDCRSASRNWALPSFRHDHLGFRPARPFP
jgi:formylglycine-generating enzyme required for sulfatase activity